MKFKYLAIAALLITILLLSIRSKAQQGFGTSSPSPSSVIDMVSTNKGVLFPRIALTSRTDVITISAPANSLTVFNTATAGTAPNNVYPGYYYWSSASNTWVRLIDVKNNYYNGITLDGINNVGLGGTLDHNSVIFYNDKSLTFLTGIEGQPFPGTHATVLDKGGLKLRYNDGGSGDASGTDYYLSIENTRTGLNINSQLGTPFDGMMTGIKSIFGLGPYNNQSYIGGQFGANAEANIGTNSTMIGVLAKANHNVNQNNSKAIGGYFLSNNIATNNAINYALYAKSTGVNPYAIYADGGSVLIKDLDNTATPVLTGTRPVYADAAGKLVIGAASGSSGNSGWGLTGNAPASGNFFGTTSNFDVPVKINNNLQYTIKEGGIDFNPAAASFDAVKPWYQLRMLNATNNNENGVYMYKDGSSQLSSYEASTGTINNFFTTIPGTTLGFPSGAYIQASNGTTTQASIIATEFDKITVSNNVPAAFKGVEYAADYSANYSPLSLITKKDLTNAITALPSNTKGRVACTGAASQIISDTNVTATAVILITYEDAAGGVISVGLGARVAGTSFVVNFAALPPTTAFINYTIIL